MYDLQTLNISIVPTGPAAFFGVQELPSSPFANSVVLNSEDEPVNSLADENEANFFYLNAVERRDRGESASGDLAVFLPRFFHFSSRDRFICQMPTINFEIMGKTADATPSVALDDRSSFFLLLLQYDKVGFTHLLYAVSHGCCSWVQ